MTSPPACAAPAAAARPPPSRPRPRPPTKNGRTRKPSATPPRARPSAPAAAREEVREADARARRAAEEQFPRARLQGSELVVHFAPGVWTKLAHVQTGTFLMGSDPAVDPEAGRAEQPQHQVRLSEYYIGKYPITNAQYAGLCPGHPSALWRRAGRPRELPGGQRGLGRRGGAVPVAEPRDQPQLSPADRGRMGESRPRGGGLALYLGQRAGPGPPERR